MRLGDLDALKEKVNTFYDSHFKTIGLSTYAKAVNIYIDNAPTVDTACPYCDSGYAQGYSDGYLRGKGELANEVWNLYEKHHSHLATYVIEFGDELKELLSKYQKGGAEK